MTDFPDLPSGTQIGPFTIERLLSKEGNMSRLFVARNQSNRIVALKVARSDDPIFKNFIQDEVAQLRKTRHPNVVHLYPIQLARTKKVYIAKGVEVSSLFNGNAPWYYAMEMIHGGSLYEHAKLISNLSLEWKIESLYQIALGIYYLHSNGVAHRDIKPDNIIFRDTPNINKAIRPNPVLVDFGIASRHNEDPRIYAATLRYASPDVVERLTGARANYRTTMTAQIDHLASDIWAFGVMAFEILVGKHPFEPYQNDDDLAEKILHAPLETMSGMTEDIQRIILGDPNTRDAYGGMRGGMLSRVREDRPNINSVLENLDVETQYLPPRY